MSDNERIIKFILDIANCYELSPQDYNEAKSLLDKYRGMECSKQRAKGSIEQNKVGHGGGVKLTTLNIMIYLPMVLNLLMLYLKL